MDLTLEQVYNGLFEKWDDITEYELERHKEGVDDALDQLQADFGLPRDMQRNIFKLRCMVDALQDEFTQQECREIVLDKKTSRRTQQKFCAWMIYQLFNQEPIPNCELFTFTYAIIQCLEFDYPKNEIESFLKSIESDNWVQGIRQQYLKFIK